MKKIIASILALSLLIGGCTHHLEKYSNESQDEFYKRTSELCKNKDELVITTIDGEKHIGKQLLITKDTTSLEQRTHVPLVMETKKVNRISFFEKERGAIDGFFNGMWVGGGVGLISVKLFKGSGQSGSALVLFYSVIVGGIVGMLYGILNPSETIIKIN